MFKTAACTVNKCSNYTGWSFKAQREATTEPVKGQFFFSFCLFFGCNMALKQEWHLISPSAKVLICESYHCFFSCCKPTMAMSQNQNYASVEL